MAIKVASLFGELSLKDNMTGALDKASDKLSEVGGNMEKIGGQVTRFGAAWTAAFAPVTVGLGVSVRDAKNFNSAMLNVNAILGITGQEAEDLHAEILSIGGASRQGPQQAAEAFYAIVSGVQDATTHMDILTASITLADAGQADLETTTKGLVNVMNAYKFAAEDASFVSDVFTQTVQMGVGSMDEFVSALSPIASLANTVGIGFDDVGAAMAFMTTQGDSASAASTQLMAIMNAFLKPNAEMTKALDEMGYTSGAAAIEGEGLIGVLQLLEQTTGGVDGTMSAALGTQEALRGSVNLLKDDFGVFSEIYLTGMDGIAQKTADIQNQNATWDTLQSKMSELSITVGNTLIPILEELMTTVIEPLIKDVVEWTQENPEATKTLILLAGAAALLGPPLMLVGTLITAAGTAATVAAPLLGLLAGPAGVFLAIAAAIGIAVVALRDFNAEMEKGGKMAQEGFGEFKGTTELLETGAVTEGDIRDQAFESARAEASQHYNSPFLGDLWARVFSNQIADAAIGKAAGGPVGANTPYMVGEEGPELFVPGSSGTIVPNHAMGGINVGSVTIHAETESGGRAAARGFKQELEEIMRRRG